MSIKFGQRGIIPNWIEENDWSPEKRLDWANQIMVFSSRDWSINFYRGDIPESHDFETWALYCLIASDTKEEALENWWNLCDETVITIDPAKHKLVGMFRSPSLEEYVPTTDVEACDFGCPHCAGMGYMDFPSNQKPCPIPGHLERYQSNLKIVNKQTDSLKRKWSALDGPCPYCKAEEECEHWTGLGWTKQVSKIV